MGNQPIYHKSEYDFILRLKDGSGKYIPWPDHDWVARFTTAGRFRGLTASCFGGVCRNCFRDGDEIHIVADRHNLPPGVVSVEFTSIIPNEDYPDGVQSVVQKGVLDLNLTNEATPMPEAFEVELLLPYIKGDKGDAFTYEDFTPEQIAELQKPATDKAAEVTEALKKVAGQLKGYAKTEELQKKQDALSVTEDLRLTDEGLLGLTEMAKKRLFIDLWNKACQVDGLFWGAARIVVGRYNEATGFFELNGLTDITYEQALVIYDQYVSGLSLRYCRTNLQSFTNTNNFSLVHGIETEVIHGTEKSYIKNFNAANSTKIREVKYIEFSMLNSSQFQGMSALETIEGIRVSAKGTFSVKECPKLNVRSVKALVDANPEGNTIQTHPDVYAKLTNPENAEWFAVLEAALAKNISFATV